eukprot:CAMPEP_0201575328 /NCGR_PEP_ID=MMETSP0190_2-20130828/20449_1 /ASSEMBLY_ACC=CAM_ASM_000263 /TAXON_ID=37353 /ORGANISM="Rosalina sp." /LENGTH=497 /DNA_ID=CAMNT_0048004803 /DNA_START=40 /DNA_END=1530 /DNA_ORIENTATION=+
MNGLRDITQQCGQPTALSQLSTNITATNPNILADAQVYKQGPGGPQGPNPMQVQQHVPSAQNLMDQFSQQKPMQPMPMPQQMSHSQSTQSILSRHASTESQQSQQSIHGLPPHQQMQMQVQPQMHQIPQPMMMQMPMHPMMMHQMQQMPPQMYQQMQNMNITQKQEQPKQQETKEKEEDAINTNGTQDMKDEKEVQDELDNLRPTYKDVQQINNLLDETKSDDKMANSQFMDFLRNLKNRPPVADQQFDQSQLWADQFQGWNDPNDIDNMNWDSYMQAIDPTKTNDPEYEFSENNPYIQQEPSENKNDDNVNYFEEGLRLMQSGNLNEAILAFEACVKKEPERSEGWRYLGICHADNENENGAISAYLKCNQLDPYDLDALLQLGVSYTNEIDPFRALNYLKQWMGNHPDYSMLADEADLKQQEPKIKPGILGGWSGSKEEHKKVVALFNKALSVNPTDSELHSVLGVLYNITSEFDIAENHFKKAIQSSPKDPSLW